MPPTYYSPSNVASVNVALLIAEWVGIVLVGGILMFVSKSAIDRPRPDEHQDASKRRDVAASLGAVAFVIAALLFPDGTAKGWELVWLKLVVGCVAATA